MDTQELKLWCMVIIDPRCWIRIGRTNKVWDAAVRATLTAGHLPDKYILSAGKVLTLNGTTIWCGNYPYGYGHPYDRGLDKSLPSRRTCILLRRAELVGKGSPHDLMQEVSTRMVMGTPDVAELGTAEVSPRYPNRKFNLADQISRNTWANHPQDKLDEQIAEKEAGCKRMYEQERMKKIFSEGSQ